MPIVDYAGFNILVEHFDPVDQFLGKLEEIESFVNEVPFDRIKGLFKVYVYQAAVDVVFTALFYQILGSLYITS